MLRIGLNLLGLDVRMIVGDPFHAYIIQVHFWQTTILLANIL